MTAPTEPPVDPPVYLPAADSDLLVEAATRVLEPGWLVVDTGTGSGVVADRLRREADVRVVATDINPHACRAAADRGLDVVRASLLDAIADASVDAAVFNPPYLPADDRLPDDWLDRATTGGPTGGELLGAWIADLPRVLVPGGVAVCVVSSLTGVAGVTEDAAAAGVAAETLSTRRFPFERLLALELRPTGP